MRVAAIVASSHSWYSSSSSAEPAALGSSATRYSHSAVATSRAPAVMPSSASLRG